VEEKGEKLNEFGQRGISAAAKSGRKGKPVIKMDCEGGGAKAVGGLSQKERKFVRAEKHSTGGSKTKIGPGEKKVILTKSPE